MSPMDLCFLMEETKTKASKQTNMPKQNKSQPHLLQDSKLTEFKDLISHSPVPRFSVPIFFSLFLPVSPMISELSKV